MEVSKKLWTGFLVNLKWNGKREQVHSTTPTSYRENGWKWNALAHTYVEKYKYSNYELCQGFYCSVSHDGEASLKAGRCLQGNQFSRFFHLRLILYDSIINFNSRSPSHFFFSFFVLNNCGNKKCIELPLNLTLNRVIRLSDEKNISFSACYYLNIRMQILFQLMGTCVKNHELMGHNESIFDH